MRTVEKFNKIKTRKTRRIGIINSYETIVNKLTDVTKIYNSVRTIPPDPDPDWSSHSPLYCMERSRSCLHASICISHSFAKVTSLLAQTGSLMLLHRCLHTHLPLSHSAPSRHLMPTHKSKKPKQMQKCLNAPKIYFHYTNYSLAIK